MSCREFELSWIVIGRVVIALGLAILCESARAGERSAGQSNLPVNTTLNDYFQHGTQPNGAGVPGQFDELLPALQCYNCHSNYGSNDPFTMTDIYQTWSASMMGQSARDPLVHALITISNQAVTDSGVFCLRCHAPVAFLSGHAVPSNGSAMQGKDFEGLNCNFCHRAVNPVYTKGESPQRDAQILGDLTTAGLMVPQGSNARYIVDPVDSRRGPFDDVPWNIHPGTPQPEILHSPFHMRAEMCWTCHDVSNPLMTKVGSTYVLNDLDAAHPTGEQTQMLPLHRTYSEWLNSYYSTVGVQHNGRFGGNHATGILKDCQDCHMPDMQGYGSNYDFEPFFERPDMPQHSFMGSNYWVLNAVRTVDFNGDGLPDFPDQDTHLTDESVAGAIERNLDFLQRASDLELTRIGPNLRTRLINFTGHKLPTGFPDGRRIWINVKFFDCQQNLIHERGAYDFATATLTPDTEIYEIKCGIQGEDYAQSLGLPQGHTFHFMLANAILKDNRIPPAGFGNPIANQLQTQSVGAFYPNGQNWDDTLYQIPAGATKAVVTVYYQLTSREFIEFLRDENITDNKGQIVYDLWVENGMSAPVEIDMAELIMYRPQDINKDGLVDVQDLLLAISGWGQCPAPPAQCAADVNGDGVVNVTDLLSVINNWGPCL